VSLNVTVRQLVLTTIGTALVIACVLIGVRQAGLAEEPTAVTADSTPSVASRVLSVQPTRDVQTQPQPQPVLATVPIATLLTRFLKAEAGPADRPEAWAGHIRAVRVGLQTATVRTDLTDSPADQRLAQEIADVAARFVVSAAGQPVSPPDIEVVGANEQKLAMRVVSRLADRGRRP
jgi:hypothetical protein